MSPLFLHFRGLAAFLLLGLSGILTPPGASAGPQCAQDFAEIINPNARIPAARYRRPNARGTDLYQRFLGQRFAAAVAKLGPGKTWIDSGGGFGVAGLQVASKQGAKVHVINAQDFWEALAQDSLDPYKLMDIADSLKISNQGLPPLKRSTATGGRTIRYREASDLEPKHLDLMRERIRKAVERQREAGTFSYDVGFAEAKLPEIPGKADLITDLYGAFFYSAGRMKLLDLYYSKLKPRGVALIRIRTGEQVGVWDTVAKKAGSDKDPQDLFDFLVEKYPRVFQLDKNDPKVLIMRRSPEIESLDLDGLLVERQVKQAGFDDTSLPQVTWEQRKGKRTSP